MEYSSPHFNLSRNVSRGNQFSELHVNTKIRINGRRQKVPSKQTSRDMFHFPISKNRMAAIQPLSSNYALICNTVITFMVSSNIPNSNAIEEILKLLPRKIMI